MRQLLKILQPERPIHLTADDMYFLTKHELASFLMFMLMFFCEAEYVGQAECFDVALSDSAQRFKRLYEKDHPDSLVWVPWLPLVLPVFI